MASATAEFSIKREDGWTLVASNVTHLHIQPSSAKAWTVAFTASGAPAAGIHGLERGNDKPNCLVSDAAITGEVYVRVITDDSIDPVRFTVLSENA